MTNSTGLPGHDQWAQAFTNFVSGSSDAAELKKLSTTIDLKVDVASRILQTVSQQDQAQLIQRLSSLKTEDARPILTIIEKAGRHSRATASTSALARSVLSPQDLSEKVLHARAVQKQCEDIKNAKPDSVKKMAEEFASDRRFTEQEKVQIVRDVLKGLASDPSVSEQTATEVIKKVSEFASAIQMRPDDIRSVQRAMQPLQDRFDQSGLVKWAYTSPFTAASVEFTTMLKERMGATDECKRLLGASMDPTVSANLQKQLKMGVDVSQLDTKSLQQFIGKQLSEGKYEIVEDVLTKCWGFVPQELFARSADRIPAVGMSMSQIQINDHPYRAIGPRSVVGGEVKDLPAFVDRAATSSILVNLMGRWQVGQCGRQYIPPMPNDPGLREFQEGQRQVLQSCAMLLELNPNATLKEMQEAFESKKGQLDKLSQNKTYQTMRNRWVTITQLGDLEKQSPQVVFEHILRTQTDFSERFAQEKQGQDKFNQLYSAGESSSGMRVFNKVGSPQERAFCIGYDEGTVGAEQPEDFLRRSLIEHLEVARDLAKEFRKNPEAFVHCDKGMDRTGQFLFLLELFRNDNLGRMSDAQLQVFIVKTIAQLRRADSGRGPDLRVALDPAFMQAVRNVAAGGKPGGSMSSSAATTATSAAAAAARTTSRGSF